MEVGRIKKADKSTLAYYPFSRVEVLEDNTEIHLRKYDLERAMSLGNLYKHSVNIYFQNTSGETMLVSGSIWAITSQFIQMKGDITIPIHAISRVDI